MIDPIIKLEATTSELNLRGKPEALLLSLLYLSLPFEIDIDLNIA
jgi:hypothetical protein